VLFIPTSPEIVPVPVINVWAMTEKVAAAPNPGSVAANVVVGPAIPSMSAILNMTTEALLIIFIDLL
jgi:hypothetical protein